MAPEAIAASANAEIASFLMLALLATELSIAQIIYPNRIGHWACNCRKTILNFGRSTALDTNAAKRDVFA
jgi:hypothetical protein